MKGGRVDELGHLQTKAGVPGGLYRQSEQAVHFGRGYPHVGIDRELVSHLGLCKKRLAIDACMLQRLRDHHGPAVYGGGFADAMGRQLLDRSQYGHGAISAVTRKGASLTVGDALGVVIVQSDDGGARGASHNAGEGVRIGWRAGLACKAPRLSQIDLNEDLSRW